MEKLPVSEYSENRREGIKRRKYAPERDFSELIDYPKEFSNKYYENFISKQTPKTSEWYIWYALFNYAKEVRVFYSTAMQALNNTTHQPAELPSFIVQTSCCSEKELNVNMPILDSLAQNLTEAENKLLDCLERNRTSISARSNKYSAINALRKCAAKAWLVYDNFKVDNFYHAIIDFKSRNEDKNMAIDRDVALVTTGHYKAKNFVQTKVNGYFSTNGIKNPFLTKHGRTARLYEDIDANELFLNLMQMFNGYIYQNNEQNIQELEQNLTEEKAKMVINFYKNIADVKRVYKSLNHIIRESLNNNIDNLNEFLDVAYLERTGTRRDLFLVAQTYLAQITELLEMAEQNPEYAFVLKDRFLQQRLQQTINNAEPIYSDLQEQRKKSLEEFKQRFPNSNL